MDTYWPDALAIAEARVTGDVSPYRTQRLRDQAEVGRDYVRRAHVLLYKASDEGSYIATHCVTKASTLLEQAAALLPAVSAHEAMMLSYRCDEAISGVVPQVHGLAEAAEALMARIDAEIGAER